MVFQQSRLGEVRLGVLVMENHMDEQCRISPDDVSEGFEFQRHWFFM